MLLRVKGRERKLSPSGYVHTLRTVLVLTRKSTENGFCSHENGDFGAVSLTDAPSHLIKVPEELFLMEYFIRVLVTRLVR